MHDSAAFGLGLALRLALFAFHAHIRLPYTLETLVVGPEYTREAVLECSFRLARGLDRTNLPCGYPFATGIARMLHLIPHGKGREDGVVVALALAAQFATCGIVYWASHLPTVRDDGGAESSAVGGGASIISAPAAETGVETGVETRVDAEVTTTATKVSPTQAFAPEDGAESDSVDIPRDPDLGAAWRVLWLNPITLASALTSPASSIHHLLLSATWVLALAARRGGCRGRGDGDGVEGWVASNTGSGYAIASVAMLLPLACTHLAFVCLLPSLLVLCHSSSGGGGSSDGGDSSSAKNTGKKWVLNGLAVTAAAVAFHTHRHALTAWIALHFTLNPSEPLPPNLSPLSPLPYIYACVKPTIAAASFASSTYTSSHTPSAGILWYLDAQVFSEVRSYFALLVAAQPAVLCGPLLLLLGPRMPLAAVHVAAALVFFYERNTGYADIVYIVAMLATHTRTVRRMRYLPPVVGGMVVVWCVQPVTYDLWMRLGTGNANFLFFQGLALWVLAALGLIDFLGAASAEVTRDAPRVELENEKKD